MKCNFIKEEVLKCEEFGDKKAIRIGYKEREFLFTVETTGVMKPEDIVRKAIRVLSEKLKVIQEDIE